METTLGSDNTHADPQPLVGYPKLARMMSKSDGTAIFRRFGELNIMNLLRLQAELHDLEYQLQEIRQEDADSNDADRVNYVKDFRLMKDCIETNDSLQYELQEQIGEKLEAYNKALIQAKELAALPKPNKRNVKFLQQWLLRPEMGDRFLVDREETIWDASNIHDLVALQPDDKNADAFSSLLDGRLLTFYHRIYGHKQMDSNSDYANQHIREYKDDQIFALSKALSGLISSLLPTIVILILYFVNRMLVRIGLVILFTAIFSLTISLLTDAKRAEVFSATAAFAAVEVVFIGSTATNGTN